MYTYTTDASVSCMKRRELERRIDAAAKAAGLTFEMVRDSGSHEVWSLDGQLISIPRHREVNEYTAEGVMKALEPKLGKGWWR